MQLQNPFFNLSKESKQINSTLDNNSSNSFNSGISSTNINNYSNNNKEEKEKTNSNNNKELKEKNNQEFNKTSDTEKLRMPSSENKIFSSLNAENSQTKIEKNLDDNFLDFNKSNEKIENNICGSINDDNFFNFSFYNNNNKNINNNYYNKLIENNNNYFDNNNDEKKINYNNDEERMNNPNNNQNNNQPGSPKHTDIKNKSTIKKFDQNKIRNERSTFFSIENSDSNFRKKTNNNNHLKVRYGDWICPNCENLNFAFRNKCNRCGLSKENLEQNENHLQIHENSSNEGQRPIMINNININYIYNSIFPINNINIINNPIIMNNTNVNNYYGNYNNYQIYSPCNVNIK